jgi:hypothetical protein
VDLGEGAFDTMTEQKLVRDPKKVNLVNAIISLLSLAAIFAMAYGFDRWSELLRRQAFANFTWISYYWFLSISNLIFPGLMLVLAWFICFRTNRTRVISAVFLIVGLLVTFAFVIVHSIVAVSSGSITTAIFLPSPDSRVVYVSAIAAAIGIAGLVLSKFNHD